MDTIMIVADDPQAMQERLAQEGLEESIVRRRSGFDPHAIVLALGGGVGIATVVKSIDLAIKSYFAGRAALAHAKKETIRITVRDQSLECTAVDVESVLHRLLGGLSS
jgi:hypothetical protein